MQHEAKASPDGRQYQALLADGSLVDTSLSIAALALTPEDTVEVRWSAEAAGVHMSVHTEGRGASGAGQHKKSGNRMAQGSTRSSAVKQSAVPHTGQLQSQLLQLQPPLWQLQSPVLRLQSPRLCNLSPLLLTKVSFASLFVFRLASAGSCKIGQCSRQYHNQFLMHRNMMQETVYMLSGAAGCVAYFCLRCQSRCVYLLVVCHHLVVFGEPRQPLCMLQKQLA